MTTTLYTCLVEEQNATEAFVQVYWARAPHLGAAIEMMLASAKANGLLSPIAQECDPYDIDNLGCEVAPSKDADVFWSLSRFSFPHESSFELPTGIIASCTEGESAIDDLTPCFSIERDAKGLIAIEANVEQSRLASDYSVMLRLFPKYEVFWYVLHDHWENQEEDKFLVNEELNAPERILAHIDENKADSILNGFVTLTAYLKDGATNLTLSDHKRIMVTTYSPEVAEQCLTFLKGAGYPHVESPARIDRGIYHWHYRLSASRSKRELEEMLKESGFSDWKP
ncbi:hypothetical protein KQI84_08475 [bacterium]|nr:hypothetical protein [bacterium]